MGALTSSGAVLFAVPRHLGTGKADYAELDTGDIRLGQVHIVSDILRIICDATGCGHLLIGEGDGATVKRITGLEYQRKKCAAEPIERIVISRIAQDARTLCHSSALQHMGGTQDVAGSDLPCLFPSGIRSFLSNLQLYKYLAFPVPS